MNKLQFNSNQNTKFFIHDNAFQNVVYGMVVIVFRPQCDKHISHTMQGDISHRFQGNYTYHTSY